MMTTKVEQTILSAKFACRINEQPAHVKATVTYNHLTAAVSGIKNISVEIGHQVIVAEPIWQAEKELPDLPLAQYVLNLFPGLEQTIMNLDWQAIYKGTYMTRFVQLLSLGFVRQDRGYVFGNNHFFVSDTMMRELDDQQWKGWMVLFLNTQFN